MPNIENINKIIDWIKADDAKHFRMASFVMRMDGKGRVIDDVPDEYLECRTAFCICGSANMIRLNEAKVDWKRITGDDFASKFSDTITATDWLGIDQDQAHDLFYASPIGIEWFDSLPKKVRFYSAIAVLETLRDKNVVDWAAAVDAGKKQAKARKIV